MSERQALSPAKKRVRAICGGFAAMVALNLHLWGFSLDTEHYELSRHKLSEDIRIVFISDLHNCFYGGKDQSLLIGEIDKAEPDLVLFGGDVIDQYGGTDYSLTLMKYVSERYPTCYTEGNHEQFRDDLSGFEDRVRALGIDILQGSVSDFEIKGQNIHVFGMTEPYEKTPDCEKYKPQLDSCMELLDPDEYNILLLHQPEEYSELEERVQDFDLILSGHAHGGQWRLPFILEQGLFAPDQGILPETTNGCFDRDGTPQIVSRGLAIPMRMCFIPRIFNRPELTIIEVKGTKPNT